MEELKSKLDVIFTLARVKQIELDPNNEAALVTIIEIKKELYNMLDDAQKAD